MYSFRCTIAAIATVISVGGAQAADLMTKAPPVAFADPSSEVWAGFDVQNFNTFGYAGGTVALNKHLYQDGWLFRVEGGDGAYSYLRAVGFDQHVDFQSGSAMIGYRANIGNGALVTGYVGAYVQNDNNPDPLAIVTGTKWGVKGQGEAYIPFNQNWYAYLLGSYTTAWRTYNVIGRLGYQANPIFSFGPEAMALRDDRYDWDRAGGFVSFMIMPRAQLIFSVGYSWDRTANSLNNASSAYGTVFLRTDF